MTIRRDVPQPIQVSIVMISQINCLSLKRGENMPPAPRLCGPMSLKRALISKYHAKAVHSSLDTHPWAYTDFACSTSSSCDEQSCIEPETSFMHLVCILYEVRPPLTRCHEPQLVSMTEQWWGSEVDIFRQISHKYYINNTSASLSFLLAVLRQNVSHSVCRSSFNDSHLFLTTQCCSIAADFISYTLWHCAM